jgi:23S rRNA pseudouridine1911/1915/1917 synthase
LQPSLVPCFEPQNRIVYYETDKCKYQSQLEPYPIETDPNRYELITREVEIVMPAGKEAERLDQFLARQVADVTRSKIQELIESGHITVDGKPTKPSHKTRGGEVVRVVMQARPPLELTPEPIPLSIVFEDEWLVVIDKPPGMVVHPAKGNRSGTLVNALLSHYGQLEPATDGDVDRPGMVHRIDKNTSGLLVVCKREPAMSRLSAQFRLHTVEREYHAVVWWPMSGVKGTIDGSIGRDPHDRQKYAVTDDGKTARTHWKVLQKLDFLSYLALRLETGRTHQIRVHMSHTGHPVFGDPEYSGRNRQMGKLTTAQRKVAADLLALCDRQLLHARVLGFEHPVTGERLSFESPLPDDFQAVIARANEG